MTRKIKKESSQKSMFDEPDGVITVHTNPRVALTLYEDGAEQAIKLEIGTQSSVIPRSHFAHVGKQAHDRLLREGMPITKTLWTKIMDAVEKLARAQPRRIYFGSGHVPGGYVAPDGAVYVAKKVAPGVAAFEHRRGVCAQAGSLAEYQQAVFVALKPHGILLCAAIIPLAAVLLKDSGLQSFGLAFRCADPDVCDLVVQTAASIMGSPVGEPHQRYQTGYREAIDHPGVVLAAHRDTVIVLDKPTRDLPGKSRKSAEDLQRTFVLEWAGAGGASGRAHLDRRNLILTAGAADDLPAADFAAAHGLFTIPIDQLPGAFDPVSSEGACTGELAAALRLALPKYHGQPFAEMVRTYVDRTADNRRLRAPLNRQIDGFRKRVGARREESREWQIAGAFGLLTAAASFARHYGILPKRFNYSSALGTIYRLCLEANQPPVPLAEQLRNLAAHPAVINLSAPAERKLSELREAPALLRVGEDGERELLLTAEALKRQFGSSRAFMADAQVAGMLVADSDDHKGKKVRACGHDLGRVYIFRLGYRTATTPDSKDRELAPPVAPIKVGRNVLALHPSEGEYRQARVRKCGRTKARVTWRADNSDSIVSLKNIKTSRLAGGDASKPAS